MNTKQIADEIVTGLTDTLSKANLPGTRSVFVSGSYCRGDWLDSSSDLDVAVLLRGEAAPAEREQDMDLVRSAIGSIMGSRPFPSQCPGGVDLCVISDDLLPKTREEAGIPSPYPPFSVTMFDLKAHSITLYGEEINSLLPESPSPAECAGDWLCLLSRRLGSLQPDEGRRAMFLAYKAVTAAQLHFGEPTLHKYRMLELYQANVPAFPEKCFGERVIRNYIGSFYPERPPVALGVGECGRFVDGLAALVSRHGSI